MSVQPIFAKRLAGGCERTMPQTILIVAHAWYDDLYGGAFRVATELARGLVRAGWHVTYVCWNAANRAEQETIDGVEIRRYRLPVSAKTVPRFWQHVVCSRTLIKQIARQTKIIAVNGHSPLQYLGAMQAIGSNARTRCSFVVHSPFADEQLASAGVRSASWRLKLRALIGSFVDGWCLRGSTVTQALSQFTGTLLTKRYGAKVGNECVVCPGWVDAARFQPAADRQAVRKTLTAEWQTSDPVIFTVRRLESRMGLETLITAAAQLAEQHPFRVLIGGAGPLREELRDLIRMHRLEQRVFLVGRIAEEQLPSCYAAADLFVLPSRSLECFGLIVLESLAAATPVIGSRTGAIPELLSELGEQWMFEPGNTDSLADCLRKFLCGELVSDADLRGIAMRYDVERLLPQWIDHCVGPQNVKQVVV